MNRKVFRCRWKTEKFDIFFFTASTSLFLYMAFIFHAVLFIHNLLILICSHILSFCVNFLCSISTCNIFLYTSETASATSVLHPFEKTFPAHTSYMHNGNIENNLTLCLKHKIKKEKVFDFSTKDAQKRKTFSSNRREKKMFTCMCGDTAKVGSKKI